MINLEIWDAVNGTLVTTMEVKLLKADPRHGRVIREDVQINSELVLNAIQTWQP